MEKKRPPYEIMNLGTIPPYEIHNMSTEELKNHCYFHYTEKNTDLALAELRYRKQWKAIYDIAEYRCKQLTK